MSEIITLEAERRSVIGKKVKQLRREGKLPAVVYGSGIEPTPIVMEEAAATKVLRSLSSSTLVKILLGGEVHTTLVRERQVDRLAARFLHIDFLAVSMTEMLTANVPVRLVGHAPVVDNFEALLLTENETLEVEALPADLPEGIEVDVSGLEELGDTVILSDLKFGEGVTILADPDTVVVVAVAATRAPTEEEEEEDLELDPDAEPEVIGRGEDDEEEIDD